MAVSELLVSKMDYRAYTIVDVETTGFDQGRHVITEIAAKTVIISRTPETDSSFPSFAGGVFSARIRLTDAEIQMASQEALEINGFTRELNETGRDRNEVRKAFDEWLHQEKPYLLVAHNASFDRRFCVAGGMVLPNVPWLCTLKAFELWQSKYKRPSSRKLAELAKVAQYVPEGQYHRAQDDVQACSAGFVRLFRDLSKGELETCILR